MRFFLFQKFWKVQELLQRHFQGFFDLIIQKPCASPFSTISGFEFILDVWIRLILRKKTREPRLLMRSFLFQKIWKIQELLRRHFEGFFDRIMGKPSTEQISTISDFELLQSWNIKIPMKMHVLEWENRWAAWKTRFGRFFDPFWSLGRLYNVYKKIFRNILFLFLFP